jgi:hypothetical protein
MLRVWGSHSMMFINSQIWRQEVNAEWRKLVGAKDLTRPSGGMFNLRELLNLIQRGHVTAIRFFGEISNVERAAA